MKTTQLLNLTVVGLKGDSPEAPKPRRGKPVHIELVYILYSDGETMVKLTRPDTTDPAAFSARNFAVHKNKTAWTAIKEYPDATSDNFVF